jgi:hypothetical protein
VLSNVEASTQIKHRFLEHKDAAARPAVAPYHLAVDPFDKLRASSAATPTFPEFASRFRPIA